MLVWSLKGRALVWSFAAIILGVIFVAPLAVIIVASFSQHWNGVVPTGFTSEHYRDAARRRRADWGRLTDGALI